VAMQASTVLFFVVLFST